MSEQHTGPASATEHGNQDAGPIDKVADIGRDIGEYIRAQRAGAKISLRQLAKLAGVSNPYLSQIERGVRKPSAEILQQIAKGLRISAEALYVQAGILDQPAGGPVADAIRCDEGLSERQKQVLLDVYESFCRENAVANPDQRRSHEPHMSIPQPSGHQPVASRGVIDNDQPQDRPENQPQDQRED